MFELRMSLIALSLVLAGCAATPARQPAAAAPGAEAAPEVVPGDHGMPAANEEVMSALMAAEFAWQDGRAESSAKHYARAAAISQDARVAEQATRVAIVAQRWDLAQAGVKRWRELDAKTRATTQADAAIALGQGKIDEAYRLIVDLLGDDNEDTRKLGAQALLTTRQPEAAAQVLQRLIEAPVANRDVDTLILLSQIAQQQKLDALARQLADRGIKRYPDSADAHVWLGHVLLRAEDKAGARAEMEKATRLAPEDKDIRLTYAAVLNDAGEAAAAARSLAEFKPDDDVLSARAAYAARTEDKALMLEAYEALRAMPEPHPEARLELLGQMAELTDRKDEARQWYALVPRGERYVDSQMRIAVLLDDAGKPDAARAQLQALRAEGIEDDSKLADTFLLEAELATRAKNDKAALAAYDAGLKVLPDERRMLYGRALLHEQADRIVESERDLRRIVELDPEDADALNALGYTIVDRTDRYEEGRALIEKAFAKKPDEPAIIDSMGWVHYRLGNFDEAIKHLKRAYELQPDAEIAAHYGEVLWKAGRKDEARALFDAALKKEPDNDTLKRTLERIKP